MSHYLTRRAVAGRKPTHRERNRSRGTKGAECHRSRQLFGDVSDSWKVPEVGKMGHWIWELEGDDENTVGN